VNDGIAEVEADERSARWVKLEDPAQVKRKIRLTKSWRRLRGTSTRADYAVPLEVTEVDKTRSNFTEDTQALVSRAQLNAEETLRLAATLKNVSERVFDLSRKEVDFGLYAQMAIDVVGESAAETRLCDLQVIEAEHGKLRPDFKLPSLCL